MNLSNSCTHVLYQFFQACKEVFENLLLNFNVVQKINILIFSVGRLKILRLKGDLEKEICIAVSSHNTARKFRI
ncbi:hypothetical protein J576_3849 [Acinetobacter sp. 766875]|nr:hypothetical protein J576_3849 [Acinetobacter sp. 766875]